MSEPQEAGIEAAAVELEAFDELLGDLRNLEPALPDELVEKLEQWRPRRVSDAPIPPTGGGYPVLRTNAFPVLEWPSTCRLVRCEVGGTAEVRRAVADAGVELIVGRRATGVIAFGRDADVRQAFAPFSIRELDLHPIEAHRLRYESAEHGLLYEALARALMQALPLIDLSRRQGRRLGVDPDRASDERLQPLRVAVGPVSGTIAKIGARWVEAVELRLEYRLDRLWLVLDPTVVVLRRPQDPAEEAAEFVRERLATRYNRQMNALIDAWRDVIFADEQEAVLHAFGIGDGVDAAFKLSSVTAFSYRSTTGA